MNWEKMNTSFNKLLDLWLDELFQEETHVLINLEELKDNADAEDVWRRLKIAYQQGKVVSRFHSKGRYWIQVVRTSPGETPQTYSRDQLRLALQYGYAETLSYRRVRDKFTISIELTVPLDSSYSTQSVSIDEDWSTWDECRQAVQEMTFLAPIDQITVIDKTLYCG